MRVKTIEGNITIPDRVKLEQAKRNNTETQIGKRCRCVKAVQQIQLEFKKGVKMSHISYRTATVISDLRAMNFIQTI